MGDAKLNHLAALLDSKNSNVRKSAVSAFSKYSIVDDSVTEVILKYLSSNSWDARTSAAEAFEVILNKTELDVLPTVKEEFDVISMLLEDIDEILRIHKPLLSENEGALRTASVIPMQTQRQAIDRHLDVIKATGLDSRNYLSDRDVQQFSSSSPSTSGEYSNDLIVDTNFSSEADEKEDFVRYKLYQFVQKILELLVDQRWQCRHGAGMVLSSIFKCSLNRLSPTVLNTCAMLLIKVFLLDRFNDFISGRNATAPVREVCARAWAHFVGSSQDRLDKTLRLVERMMTKTDEHSWTIRQSGLLITKYMLVICKCHSGISSFIDHTRNAFGDDVDDVVCTAIAAMKALITIPGAYSAENPENLEKFMDSTWLLLESETKKEHVRSGMDGVLLELLDVVERWLIVKEDYSLNREKQRMVLCMLDPAFPTRNKVIIVIFLRNLHRKTAEKLDPLEILNVITEFYRILLFSAPSENDQLLETVLETAKVTFSVYSNELLENHLLVSKIGKWIACIFLHNNGPSINVKMFDVIGISATREEEMMCREEIMVLPEPERERLFLGRKLICARFLAPFMKNMFESALIYNGMPLSTSIEYLMISFLQTSTSMHQFIGIGLVANEWSKLFSQTPGSSAEKPRPVQLMKHLLDYLSGDQSKLFDEMKVMADEMTEVSNHFLKYCEARGFNMASLQSAEASGPSDAESKCQFAFSSTQELLQEPQKERLVAKYREVDEKLVNCRKFFHLHKFRLEGLFASSLFNFEQELENYKNMIGPIFFCLESEENRVVAREIFQNSFLTLVKLYENRDKLKLETRVFVRLKSFFYGCDQRIPRVETKTTSNIITMDRFESPAPFSMVSQNAEIILESCFKLRQDQLPSFYRELDLEDSVIDPKEGTSAVTELVNRLELHVCFSQCRAPLSDVIADRIFYLLNQESPCFRFAGAKAVEKFSGHDLGPTLNKMYRKLIEMASDLKCLHRRLGAVEAFLRISLNDSIVAKVASLLGPAVFPLLADKDEEVRTAASLAFRRAIPYLTLERSEFNIDGLNEDIESEIKKNEDFVNVLCSPSNLPLIRTEDVKGLKVESLRHYQLEGITWMRFLRRYGMNGILADDMGLGKTLQTMCTVVLSLENDNLPKTARSSLIVCPRTLVDHWCSEWTRFFPDRKPAKKTINSNAPRDELYVVAYEEVKSNSHLRSHNWNYIILDEGHVMRNPKTQLWKAAIQLKARSRLILSGTPVQNSPADLWAQFTWLMPGYLGSEKEFRIEYLKKIIKCKSNKATDADLKIGNEAVAALHKIILPFALRRLKKDVLKELPEKNIQDYECKLSKEQEEIYKYILERCSTIKSESEGKNIVGPLHALMALRKLVVHPCLVSDLLVKINAPKEILTMAETWDTKSGKLEALGELLQECNIVKKKEEDEKWNDEEDRLLKDEAFNELPHRALIFCQWKSSAKLISQALTSTSILKYISFRLETQLWIQSELTSLTSSIGHFGEPVSHLLLDRDVPESERMSMINRFNVDTSIDCLVLTTHLFGLGVSLVGADIVIMLDHDWNPTVDMQAMDRAHRMGQKRTVNVYRMITTGTVEEKVLNLQKFKLNVSQTLIGSDNASLKTMNATELLDMFSLSEGPSKTGNSAGPPRKKAKKRLWQNHAYVFKMSPKRLCFVTGMSPFDNVYRMATYWRREGDKKDIEGEKTSSSETWDLEELWNESEYDSFDVKNIVGMSN